MVPAGAVPGGMVPPGGMMYAPMQAMPMGSVGAVRKTIPDSQTPGAAAGMPEHRS
jgi:hypothetical protein